MKRKIVAVIWWIYFTFLFLIVILKYRGSISELKLKANASEVARWKNYNLIPFRSLGEQFSHFSEGWARFNLMGNIIPFVPFGLMIASVFTKVDSLFKMLGISFIVVLTFEIIQYVTRLGSFDIDDILLNIVGIMIGYVGRCLFRLIKPTRK